MVDKRQLSESCFAAHLGYYLSLTRAEAACVARLEASEHPVEARELIQQRGQAHRYLYVVRSGWLYTSIELRDGRRQVLQIYNAGDIIGLQNMAFHTNTCDLTALESCRLCPFPAAEIGRMFERFPRLAALLLAIAAREQVAGQDLKRAVARLSASDRILFLLLSLLSRLQITNDGMVDTMRFPVSQAHIGDMVGLTNVSVSKAMAWLEEHGDIRRGSGTITLTRLDAAIERIDFQNRFIDIDAHWFPTATGIDEPRSVSA